MTRRTRLLVVGADAAGMSAAHQALRSAARHGRDLEVVALERTGHTSYSACGIPYWVAGDVDTGAALVARTAEQHRAAGIDLRLGAEAVGLDLGAGTVTAREAGSGAASSVGFDALVLATGAAPVTPPWALADGGGWVPGVRAVKTLDDGRAWLDLLLGRQPAPRRAVVVGGGYIGLEMAEAFVRRGLATTLVTRHEVMGSLEPELGARVRAVLERSGVTVQCGHEVQGLELGPDGRVRAVVTPDGEVPADVVALGLGVRPRTALAAGAGLAVGRFGGLLPDEHQRVADGVWAAGDCCESVERLGGARVFVPLGTHANKQGRVAGENAGGGDARFGGVLGTAVTRYAAGEHVVEVGRTGPTLAQLRASGRHDVVSLVTESTTASGYMPEASPVAVLVHAARGDGRLLGGQLVGGPGTAKRVDTVAVALWAGLTVHDVAGADLSYAPPFSPVWDPVQIACRRLAERL